MAEVFPRQIWAGDWQTVCLYFYKRVSNFGCVFRFEQSVNVFPEVHADFEYVDSAGCNPFEVDFINLSNENHSYSWIFGEDGFSDATNPSWTFQSENAHA